MAREVRALAVALKEAESGNGRRVMQLEKICKEWDQWTGGVAS